MVIREGLSEKLTFDLLKEVKEGVLWIAGKSILGRGTSQCKGPEVEVCGACLRHSEEVSVPRMKWVKGREWEII